jgi:hypothetical protein
MLFKPLSAATAAAATVEIVVFSDHIETAPKYASPGPRNEEFLLYPSLPLVLPRTSADWFILPIPIASSDNIRVSPQVAKNEVVYWLRSSAMNSQRTAAFAGRDSMLIDFRIQEHLKSSRQMSDTRLLNAL